MEEDGARVTDASVPLVGAILELDGDYLQSFSQKQTWCQVQILDFSTSEIKVKLPEVSVYCNPTPFPMVADDFFMLLAPWCLPPEAGKSSCRNCSQQMTFGYPPRA